MDHFGDARQSPQIGFVSMDSRTREQNSPDFCHVAPREHWLSSETVRTRPQFHPALFHESNHLMAETRVTPSSRATCACVAPFSKSLPASRRRDCNAAMRFPLGFSVIPQDSAA
jgi:hypothetical protein